MTITIDEVRKCRAHLAVHMSLARGGAYYHWQCIEHPRLSRVKRRETRQAPWLTSWHVDGAPYRSLADAVAALNRTHADNENHAMSETADDKVPIADQIAEAEREIRQRERLYPKWIEANKLKPETADKKLRDMRAVVKSLRWFEQNRGWIEVAYAAMKAAEREQAASDPNVATIIDGIPGTEVVAVRETAHEVAA